MEYNTQYLSELIDAALQIDADVGYTALCLHIEKTQRCGLHKHRTVGRETYYKGADGVYYDKDIYGNHGYGGDYTCLNQTRTDLPKSAYPFGVKYQNRQTFLCCAMCNCGSSTTAQHDNSGSCKRKNRDIAGFGLPENHAAMLMETKQFSMYFEEVCQYTDNFRAAANFLLGPVKSYLNQNKISITDFELQPSHISDIIALVDDGKISNSVASQQVLPGLLAKPGSTALAIAEALNLIQQSNVGELLPLVQQVLDANPEKVSEYREGKKNILSMFVGQAMKLSHGKADPKTVSTMIAEIIDIK